MVCLSVPICVHIVFVGVQCYMTIFLFSFLIVFKGFESFSERGPYFPSWAGW